MEDSDSLSEVPRADLEEEVRVLRRKVQQLEEECRYLRTLEEKVIKLEDEVQCLCKLKMSAKLIAGDDHMTKFYTGLPTHVVFLSLLRTLRGKLPGCGYGEEWKRKKSVTKKGKVLVAGKEDASWSWWMSSSWLSFDWGSAYTAKILLNGSVFQSVTFQKYLQPGLFSSAKSYVCCFHFPAKRKWEIICQLASRHTPTQEWLLIASRFLLRGPPS